ECPPLRGPIEREEGGRECFEETSKPCLVVAAGALGGEGEDRWDGLFGGGWQSKSAAGFGLPLPPGEGRWEVRHTINSFGVRPLRPSLGRPRPSLRGRKKWEKGDGSKHRPEILQGPG